jgi:hypothetical protein
LHAGYQNILDWAIEQERLEGSAGGEGGDSAAAAGGGDGTGEEGEEDEDGPPAARGSSSIMMGVDSPLGSKVEVLLDLVFRRLFWDPANPGTEFSYDSLLKLIKKVDKDMGP